MKHVGLSGVLLSAISAIAYATASPGAQATAAGGSGPVLVLQGRTELPGCGGGIIWFDVKSVPAS